MASSSLYGNQNSGVEIVQFQWFIFYQSSSAPSTPTGGAWNFQTNVGVPPSGWTNSPPTSPANQIWVSIAFVSSLTPTTLSWSVPGLWFQQGTAGQVAVGTTSTLSAGSSATVANSGTPYNAILNFGIPQGIQGIQGPTGNTGPQGPTGSTGTAATVAVGTTTTLSSGSSATVANSGTSSAAVFNFGIPQGLQGIPGSAASIAVGTTTTLSPSSSATVSNSGSSSAAVFNFGIPQGTAGTAATIAVGTTTTLAPGSSATVTNSGTSGSATFNFGIPQGTAGTAATIAVGTTTTTAPGTSATVTNSGTSSAAVFNFNIPKGAGVAAGGTTSQALIKNSNADYDTTWATITGTLAYQGTWNASTNTPTLTSSVGTNGYYYIVNVGGTTNLNGITDWQPNDWAIFNGSVWEKIDNSDLVTSVNGYTGAVTLTNTDVGAPTYTGTGASGTWGINVTGNSGTVTNGVYTTGSYSNPAWITSLAGSKVIAIPNSSLTNSSITINGTPISLGGSTSVGTVTSVSGTAPIISSGGNTPAISITQASGSTNGYLSSTDWTTFNNKGSGSVTSVSGTGTVNGISLSGTVTTSGSLTLGGTLSGIGNSQLTNSSITINGTSTSLGGSINVGTVTSVSGTGSVNGITLTGSVSSSGSLTLGGTLGNIANSQLTNSTISGIALGQNLNALTIGTGLSGSSYNGSSAVTIANTAPMVYPSAGIPNSTGSSWSTSYGVNVANGVAVFDANKNLTVNCLFEGFTAQAATGTTIVLVASSVQNWLITGSGGQTIKLPDATTLPNGAFFTFNNNQSSGTIVVQNNSGTTIATVQSGGFIELILQTNSLTAGTWDFHNLPPSNASWSTNTLSWSGSYTNGTWNGSVIGALYGGTGVAGTITGYVYANGTGAHTASTTIPTTALSGTITNAQLANSAITINGTFTSLGGSINVGTVTTASVVSANGFAGTVANASTTPAITLSTTITGLLKGNGTAISAATSGTDYAPPTSGAAILYGNGSGGFSNVTIGTGVSFSGGTLSVTGSGGTVTSVSGTGTVNGITLTGTVTSSGSLTLGGTLGSIANSQLTNSSITFGATAYALGSTISNINGVSIGGGTF